jgi:Cu(I)/Ag(I) efflux system membrane fusion protein
MADRKDRRTAADEPIGPAVPGDNAAPKTAGTGTPPMTGRQKLRLIGLVILKRVRFIAILAAVGLFIGYWDTIKNYWDKWTRPQAAAVRELEPGQEFYCPMHPQVVQTTFGPNGDVPMCPICGMPLSVHKKGDATKLPLGVTGRVQFTPERVQQAGIQTVPVEYRTLSKQTTTVGYVTFDESRLSRVVSRVSGYVEKLYVDKTFVEVRQGQPLAEVYSPDLYSTAQTLLLDAKGGARSGLLASTRTRLELLGMSPSDIDAIVASGKASPRLLIRSPRSGYVIEKKVVVGSNVEPGMTLLEVADLSAIWVEAQVYEKDMAFLRPDQKIEATVEALPNERFDGRVALIYPRLDPVTRTVGVRFELPNPRRELRPGMFATVTIKTPLEDIEPFKSLVRSRAPIVLSSSSGIGDSGGAEDRLRPQFPVVPELSVVDTGTKKVVYVQREPGLFEGREVELGPRVELTEGGRTVDYYPVIKGLARGDKVAAAGAFLIDAETRLNPAAASTYFGATGGSQSGGRTSQPAAPASRPGDQASRNPEGDKSEPPSKAAQPSAEDLKNIAQLPEADRQLAMAQRVCPITGAALGSMGVPVKITLRGQPVVLCCKGCVGKAKREPEETLKKIGRYAATATRNP